MGVVADTKTGSRDEPADDQWYAPATQPAILNGTDFAEKLTAPAGGYITLRSALPPEQISIEDRMDQLLARLSELPGFGVYKAQILIDLGQPARASTAGCRCAQAR